MTLVACTDEQGAPLAGLEMADDAGLDSGTGLNDGGLHDGGLADAHLADDQPTTPGRDAGAATDAAADAAAGDSGTRDAGVPDTPGAPPLPGSDEARPRPSDAAPAAEVEDDARSSNAELEHLDALLAMRFARVDGGDLTRHRMDADGSYHAGAALHDVDGDGDLDVFIGRRADGDGDPACLYRNASAPGTIRFERVDAWCLGDLAASSAHFVPHDVPGEARAILTGFDLYVDAVFSADGVDLMPFTPARVDAESPCDASTGALVDLDHDGTGELIVLCSLVIAESGFTRSAAADFVLDVASRPPTAADVAPWPELAPGSMSLALGVDDVDEDGLLDLVTVIDTLANPVSAPMHLEPGGVRRRCAPGDGCAWRPQPLVDSREAWGSYMGVGRIDVGDRAMYYLSDYGPNLWVELGRDGTRTNEAAAYRVGMGTGTPPWLYSWSVVPGDFDGNGLDDLFVTQGSVRGHTARFFRTHRDRLIAQTDEGRFAVFSGSIGLRLRQTVDDLRESHRGAWRADLDGDGRLDLLVTVLEGPPVIYTVETSADPAWCTLVPEPRYVPTWGFGDHATAPDGRVEHARMQGQTRLVIPRSLVTRSRAGHVVFASGAHVPFTCAPGEVVHVPEPDWLTLVHTDGAVLPIVARAAGYPPTARLRVAIETAADEGDIDVVDAGTIDLPVQVSVPDGARIMVGIGDRWVARWWDLHGGDAPGAP